MAESSYSIYSDPEIEWTEETTESGKKYRVGRPKGEATEEEKKSKDTVSIQGKKDFDIWAGWWVYDAWTATSQDVKDTAAITEYKINKNHGSVKAYTLEFKNTEHYNYLFSDDDNPRDKYRCNTWRNGTHYIDYDSKNAGISRIEGS